MPEGVHAGPSLSHGVRLTRGRAALITTKMSPCLFEATP